MSLITVKTLRERLKTGASEAEEADLLRVHADVIATWEAETHLLWERRAGHVEVLEPATDRISTLWLGLRPVESIASVEESDDGITYEVVDAAGYLILQARSIQRDGAYWRPFVRVTYTGGYSETPSVGQAKTPAGVILALAVQAQFLRTRLAPNNIAIRSQNFEGGSGVFEDATLHPTFARAAALHRRKV